ncbi:hypothetical protein B0H17DRAFT_1072838 [Mycena rosella]|uniref:Uncharacterized protein n=1 Tax=Mycena rosella TaxID=1033263 RepID=A0AAD7D9B4_MYCRO|nr:hypothetical protein B0H17DRAFT_1072838 [Mycena rosella]
MNANRSLRSTPKSTACPQSSRRLCIPSTARATLTPTHTPTHRQCRSQFPISRVMVARTSLRAGVPSAVSCRDRQLRLRFSSCILWLIIYYVAHNL